MSELSKTLLTIKYPNFNETCLHLKTEISKDDILSDILHLLEVIEYYKKHSKDLDDGIRNKFSKDYSEYKLVFFLQPLLLYLIERYFSRTLRSSEVGGIIIQTNTVSPSIARFFD
jgi:hypothetical protein